MICFVNSTFCWEKQYFHWKDRIFKMLKMIYVKERKMYRKTNTSRKMLFLFSFFANSNENFKNHHYRYGTKKLFRQIVRHHTTIWIIHPHDSIIWRELCIDFMGQNYLIFDTHVFVKRAYGIWSFCRNWFSLLPLGWVNSQSSKRFLVGMNG